MAKASVRTAIDPDAEIENLIAECGHDPYPFVLGLYPWGEPGPLRDHTGPDSWQAGFLRELGQETRRNGFNGVVAVPPVRRSVSSGNGVGKSVMAAWLVDWLMSPTASGEWSSRIR